MTFQARPQFWDENLQISEAVHAGPALMCSPHNEDLDGVAIFGERGPFFVITREAAYRLANQIADVLSEQKVKP